MEWIYETSICKFSIKPLERGFVLFIDDIRWSWYATAELAADDVATKSTGFDEWDNCTIEPPYDLLEWKRVQL